MCEHCATRDTDASVDYADDATIESVVAVPGALDEGFAKEERELIVTVVGEPCDWLSLFQAPGSSPALNPVAC